jgi:lipopolysaccharide transport system permease protein
MLTKLAANRHVLKNLVVRDLQRRYVGSIGGFLWSVIHPLALLASYDFFFSILGIPVDSHYSAYNFPVFVYCGLLPWLFLSDTVMRNCTAITDNSILITKTVIPAEILPISITISNLIHHAIGLGIFLVILVLFFQVHASVFLILLYLPIMMLFAQGLGWILAGLQVYIRDTLQALQILMLLWFWFTPVLYTMTRIPENWRMLGHLNPMVTIVTGYRNALLNQGMPAISDIVLVFATSAAVFVVGALLFRHAKPGFADVL